MRLLPTLLAASLAGNAAFGLAAWLHSPTAASVAPTAAATRPASTAGSPWSYLAGEDPLRLAQNLRSAGFPPDVIRAVLQAKVSARYDAELRALARRSQEELPYWQPRSFSHGAQARINESWSRLVTERGRAVRDALAAAGLTTAGDEASATQRRQYGDLPAGKITLIERIDADYAELRGQLRDATQGIILPADLTALALLEQERRRDLGAVLSPTELEDYLMRTSPITARLRPALTLMDASETEFRAIYAAYLPHAETLFPTLASSSSGPEAFQRRREASAALAAQVQATLGPARAAEFDRANNPEFQALSRLAASSGLPGDAAARTFAVRAQAAQESTRIAADGALNVEQKRAALTALADQAKAQITATLGPQAGNSYLQGAGWLGAISQGLSVQFDGAGTQFRSVQEGPRVVVPPGGSATVITTPTPGTTTTPPRGATPPPK